MPGFHVEHKLVDYNKWFEVFKPGTVRKEVQEDHGVSAIRILRDNEDPNHCIVVFEAPDRDSFEKFDSDPRVQERLNDTSLFVERPQLIGEYTPVDL